MMEEALQYSSLRLLTSMAVEKRRCLQQGDAKRCQIDTNEALLRNVLSNESHTLTNENFEDLSRDTEGYSGADMKTLCKRAARVPLHGVDIMHIDGNSLPPISYDHFCQALSCMNPSVAQDSLQVYDDWNKKYLWE